MNASERDWSRLQNVALLLLVLGFCLYLPTLFHSAFADDEIYLAYSNRFLRESNWSELYQLFLKPTNPWEYLPLRDFTYWLDFRLYGDELYGFHLTNLIWYLASCLSVGWMFRELILFCRPGWREKAFVLSLAGTVLFSVHPAHVEVVAWIASRKDLMAGTLLFLSLGFLLNAVRHGWLRRQIAWAAFFLVLACFSKAATVTSILLIALLIGAAWPSRSGFQRRVPLAVISVFTVLVVFAAVVHYAVGQETGIQIANDPGLSTKLERASRIQTGLIGILLFPYPLQFYHDVYQFGSWHWWVSGFSVLIGICAALMFLRFRSLWAFGVLLALTPLTIYLQFIPFTTWSLASERFVFVSVAGFALLFIDIFGRFARPEVILLALLAIVPASAVIVWSRVHEWELGTAMLAREYERQPGFHNAVRDHIVFTLLPQRRYEESEVLSRKIRRSYATDALLALVATERTYREMTEAGSEAAGVYDRDLQRRFCSAVSDLGAATLVGYRSMKGEADISYNNILRTLDKLAYYRFGDSKRLCDEHSADMRSSMPTRP